MDSEAFVVTVEKNLRKIREMKMVQTVECEPVVL